METMRSFFTWALIISMSCSLIGFWAYTLEMIQGRVTMRTRWSELNCDQVSYFTLATLGLGCFLMSLFGLVIIRGHA